MDEHLWVHIDHRGLSRQTEELWIPHLDADAIWLTNLSPDDDDGALLQRTVPVLELTPAHIAALAAESASGDAQPRAIVLLSTLDELREAVDFGLTPRRITIVTHQRDNGRRLAANVLLDDRDEAIMRDLEAEGFTFVIQALPNVTPRPVSMTSLNAAANA